MEMIRFEYDREDTYDHSVDTTSLTQTVKDRDDCGLKADDVCAAFCDFMDSAGFSMESIMKYFSC